MPWFKQVIDLFTGNAFRLINIAVGPDYGDYFCSQFGCLEGGTTMPRFAET